MGALELGFASGKTLAEMMQGGVDLLWLLGADEFDTSKIGAATFVVYQGHHGDRGAARADVILPGAAYTEKSGTYISTEGRVQRGELAVFPPGEAKEDWKILRAFSAMIDKPLPYDTLDAVRARLVAVNPIFDRLDVLPRFGCSDLTGPAAGVLGAAPFTPLIANYYMTDPISRSSATMAECTAAQATHAVAAE
jgi:NADH-quinone oxidoreductase subunit G